MQGFRRQIIDVAEIFLESFVFFVSFVVNSCIFSGVTYERGPERMA